MQMIERRISKDPSGVPRIRKSLRLLSCLGFFLASIAPSWVLAATHEKKTMQNGLEIVTLEVHKVPLVTIVLAVKAGAFTEKPETNGLTHLWEHMFFKGNAAIPNQEAFRERIRDLGIIYNGDTNPELVRYYFTLPSAFLREGLDFMYHAIATPLIDEKELERERRVVLDEYDRNASQTGFELYRLRQKTIYGALSYLRNPLGERPLIEKASRADLMRIKEEVFVPQNSSILISGDFDTAEAQKIVEETFKPWQNPKDWKPLTIPAMPPFPKTPITLVKTNPQARNINISFTFQGPRARLQPKDAYIADVLTGLVNHRLSSFSKRFVDSGLTYGAGFGYLTQSQAGELSLSAVTSAQRFKEVLQEMKQEPERWINEETFTASQLEDVRRSLSIQRAYEENRPSEYVKSLAFWWAVTDLSFYDDYISALQKVTLEEVRDFARRYFKDKSYVTSILLSPEDAKTLGLSETASPTTETKK